MFAGATTIPGAAGRSRRAWKPGRRGRLQPRIPAWRRRTDPLHVRLSRDLQTEDRRSSGPVDEAGRGPCAQRDAHRTALRRSSAQPAERRPGSGDPQRRAEPRPGFDHHATGGRCAPARRERSCGAWAGARVGWRSGRVARGGSTALDYIRVFASKGSVVGMPLGSLKLPGGFAYRYIHVRRGDVDLLPDDDLVLEFGDRVGVLCNRADFDAVRLCSAIPSRALPTSATFLSVSARQWASSSD